MVLRDYRLGGRRKSSCVGCCEEKRPCGVEPPPGGGRGRGRKGRKNDKEIKMKRHKRKRAEIKHRNNE